MKISKLILLAGLGALAYYLLKNKKAAERDEPGILKRFVNRVTDSVGKPVDEVAADNAVRSS